MDVMNSSGFSEMRYFIPGQRTFAEIVRAALM
jgi:hypothetical protein